MHIPIHFNRQMQHIGQGQIAIIFLLINTPSLIHSQAPLHSSLKQLPTFTEITYTPPKFVFVPLMSFTIFIQL